MDVQQQLRLYLSMRETVLIVPVENHVEAKNHLQNQNLTFAKLSLQRVFHLSSELGKIEFPLIVKSSTGYDVIPINPSYESDRRFVEILNSILKKFLKTSASTRTRYQGNRINEIGRRIEETIVNEMNKSPLASQETC